MGKKLPEITLLRVYEATGSGATESDSGYRVLVDRLWPRGVKKESLHLDEWAKDLAPSTELRKWFGHRPERWDEFRIRYRDELRSHAAAVERLVDVAAHRRLVLLYGARDHEHNQAVVLREFLLEKRSERGASA